MKRCRWTVVSAVAMVGLVACGPGPGVENYDEMEKTTQVAGASEVSEYDAQAYAFLPGYIGEDPRFGDDQLDFDVDGRVVTIRGIVDSVEERRLLVERVRRVPGVRDVDVTRLRASGL